MTKHLLAAMALAAIAGCSTESPQPQSSNSNPQPVAVAPQPKAPTEAELAAYAGAHPYPTDQQAKGEVRAAAIVDKNDQVLKVYNFGTEPIRDANVWVNQAYVRHIDAIAPGSFVKVQMSHLYDATGQAFTAKNEHVMLVQLELDHQLHSVMGPAPEHQPQQ